MLHATSVDGGGQGQSSVNLRNQTDSGLIVKSPSSWGVSAERTKDTERGNERILPLTPVQSTVDEIISGLYTQSRARVVQIRD